MIYQDPDHREKMENLRSLSGFVNQNLSLLLVPDQAWQPTDFLPDLTADDWADKLADFRKPSRQLSDELLVILVGGMITEEALPSYAISLNLLAQDQTGSAPDPWACWMRGWVAEENRHGDLLNAYLRLTGRVDMRSVELTIHNLLRNGFDPKAFPDLYGGLIYTSFQERATKISHSNLGKLASKQGDEQLSRICQRIGGDESRHEAFYTRVMGQVMENDPARAILSLRSMLRSVIAMPGRLMYDGKDPNLFDHFAVISQRMGTYTVDDYAQIIRHLISTWNIAGRSLSGPAAQAQDYLCRQADRYLAMSEGICEHLLIQPKVKFSWLHGREV